MLNLTFLTPEEVITFNQYQTSKYGGTFAIINIGSIESAVSAAQFTAFYSHGADIFLIAATYAAHIAQNHGFRDGNKRTGLMAALVFLDTNGSTFSPTQSELQELEDLMVEIAQHRKGKEELAALLKALTK